MTNNNGVIDLIQLINDMLEVRTAAMFVAIDKRDTVLASAVTRGSDSEIHRILVNHKEEADRVCLEQAYASRVIIVIGNVPIVVNDESNANLLYARSMRQLCNLADTIVTRAKNLHPMLFEQATPELIELLKEQEEKQREQEKTEANTATTSS